MNPTGSRSHRARRESETTPFLRRLEVASDALELCGGDLAARVALLRDSGRGGVLRIPAFAYARLMDAFLTIASKREVREYADRPVDPRLARLILEAGRIAGSAANRQPWDFFVVESEDARAKVAESVFEPSNVRGAPLVVVIAIRGRRQAGFDSGRVAQNMMLAAWSGGIGSCPNGMHDREQVKTLLGLEPDQEPTIVLTFGHPARPRKPEARSALEWLERADRRPLDDVVKHV
jgi:nitroreductase